MTMDAKYDMPNFVVLHSLAPKMSDVRQLN